MNCGPPDQFSGFVDLNWGQSIDSAVPNSGEIFPQPHYTSTLLNSPPKLQLSMMGYPQQQLSGLGFGERASNFGASTGQLPSRVSSWQSLRVNGLQMGGAELGNAREDSSASDPISAGGDGNARKRKVPPNGKGKDFVMSPPRKGSSKMVAEMEDSNSKRGRPSDNSNSHNDEIEPKIEQNGGVINNLDDGKEAGKESNVKPPEHPKQDFIHVRARRGQATDSHSLAERVRREKISERMKLLQDLVPGCNKVNGKALMLDEIINYVQSLQGQVEFLSMKLASVNPRSDFDVDSLIQKDIHRGSGPSLNSVHSLEDSAAAFSYSHQLQQATPLQCVMTNGLETQCSMNPLESSLHRTLSMQIHSGNGLGDPSSQLGTFWEDELHNVVQMGFPQNQEMSFSSQGFHGM